MSFWSDPVGPEPKRNYRWIVRFSAAGTPPSYALKKVDKPKAKIGSVQHKYLNHFFNYPGRLEWEDMNMTFASITTPDATNLINNVLINAGYGVPQTDVSPGPQVSTIGKRKFNGALGTNFAIIQLDSNGLEIETWRIYNPFFTSVNFGTLDYSNEEIVEITCTVKYDWAQLESYSNPDEPTTIVPNNLGFP